MNEKEVDEALFDIVFAASLQKRMEELETEADDEPIVFSENFNQRFAATFTTEKKKAAPTMRHLAAIAVVLIMIALPLSLTASRQRLLDLFLSVGSGFASLTHSDTASTKTLDIRDYQPGYMSEGFVVAEQGDNEIEYHHPSGEEIIYCLYNMDLESVNFDTEAYRIDELILGERRGLLLESQDGRKPHRLVWEQEGHLFELAGYLEMDELKKIAESVKK